MRLLISLSGRSRSSERLAQADAEALIRDHGADAYARPADASVTWFYPTGRLMLAARPSIGGALRSSSRAWQGSESASIRRRGCFAGGVNARSMAARFSATGVDLIALSEAEETIVSIARALEGHGTMTAIPGVAFLGDDGRERVNGGARVIRDLDELRPSPCRPPPRSGHSDRRDAGRRDRCD